MVIRKRAQPCYSVSGDSQLSACIAQFLHVCLTQLCSARYLCQRAFSPHCIGQTYCIINTIINPISKDLSSCLKTKITHHPTVLLPCMYTHAMRSRRCSEERIINRRDGARRLQIASLICCCINIKKRKTIISKLKTDQKLSKDFNNSRSVSLLTENTGLGEFRVFAVMTDVAPGYLSCSIQLLNKSTENLIANVHKIPLFSIAHNPEVLPVAGPSASAERSCASESAARLSGTPISVATYRALSRCRQLAAGVSCVSGTPVSFRTGLGSSLEVIKNKCSKPQIFK